MRTLSLVQRVFPAIAHSVSLHTPSVSVLGQSATSVLRQSALRSRWPIKEVKRDAVQRGESNTGQRRHTQRRRTQRRQHSATLLHVFCVIFLSVSNRHKERGGSLKVAKCARFSQGGGSVRVIMSQLQSQSQELDALLASQTAKTKKKVLQGTTQTGTVAEEARAHARAQEEKVSDHNRTKKTWQSVRNRQTLTLGKGRARLSKGRRRSYRVHAEPFEEAERAGNQGEEPSD
jgi:hypothetical protein